MTDPLIVTRDLVKEYRMESYTVAALRGVSLGIAAGEFVGVASLLTFAFEPPQEIANTLSATMTTPRRAT